MMIVQFRPDDGRRVYAVPVTLAVECTLYVLAKDHEQAVRYIKATDLEDYFSFDQDSLSTDGEQLLKIDDVVAPDMEATIIDISELSTDDYPPNEHPDFSGELKK
jgi:hypothetical protein